MAPICNRCQTNGTDCKSAPALARRSQIRAIKNLKFEQYKFSIKLINDVNPQRTSIYILFSTFFRFLQSSREAGILKLNLSSADTVASKQVNSPVFMYGIPSDSFDLIPGHIKRNGFLSEILLKHGVTMQEIDQVLKNSSAVFDVRKIQIGKQLYSFL